MPVPIDSRLSDCPMVTVSCRRCGGQMLARKSSWNQTSVQWNAEASAGCVERRHPAAQRQGVFMACSALAESIAGAVRDGNVPIVDESL
ncbi:ferredoxin [Mycobacterium cookii]|uniref:ferredoxin n=1 Tax=Mycobacterium cookii TaxID=1775 RepID=UPI0014793F7D|nr:ferredoxin [Mycobacterium cookii]